MPLYKSMLTKGNKEMKLSDGSYFGGEHPAARLRSGWMGLWTAQTRGGLTQHRVSLERVLGRLLRHHPCFYRDLPAHEGPAHSQCAG